MPKWGHCSECGIHAVLYDGRCALCNRIHRDEEAHDDGD